MIGATMESCPLTPSALRWPVCHSPMVLAGRMPSRTTRAVSKLGDTPATKGEVDAAAMVLLALQNRHRSAERAQPTWCRTFQLHALLFSCLIVRTSGYLERSRLCLLIAYPITLTWIG